MGTPEQPTPEQTMLLPSRHGWKERTTPHPNPQQFVPTLENLVLASFIRSDIGEQMVLALCKPGIAVDKHGKLFVLEDGDFEGIVNLARAAAGVIPPGERKWHEIQSRGSSWTESLWVNDERGMKNIEVHGFLPWIPTVEAGISDRESLPNEIFEILRLIEEAKGGGVAERDVQMLKGVQEVIMEARSNKM